MQFSDSSNGVISQVIVLPALNVYFGRATSDHRVSNSLNPPTATIYASPTFAQNEIHVADETISMRSFDSQVQCLSSWTKPKIEVFKELRAGDFVIHLKRDTEISAIRDDFGLWASEDPRLGIYVSGFTAAEAFDAFGAELGFLWHEIASAENDALTEDAIHLKTRLHQLITKVEKV